jgi:hypothetical protein
MKKFTDALADLIIKNEIPRIDNIMREVTQNISIDFAKEMFALIDAYYDNYTPIRYVRVYGPKRKLRTKSGKTKRKPRGGQVSLHAAVTRGGEGAPAIAVSGGSFEEGYFGGIAFDPINFSENGMRHIGKGEKFSEWNIVENFLFAGEGGYGDIRSHIEYSHPSADQAMWDFMQNYDTQFDMHYKNALKNNS